MLNIVFFLNRWIEIEALHVTGRQCQRGTLKLVSFVISLTFANSFSAEANYSSYASVPKSLDFFTCNSFFNRNFMKIPIFVNFTTALIRIQWLWCRIIHQSRINASFSNLIHKLQQKMGFGSRTSNRKASRPETISNVMTCKSEFQNEINTENYNKIFSTELLKKKDNLTERGESATNNSVCY